MLTTHRVHILNNLSYAVIHGIPSAACCDQWHPYIAACCDRWNCHAFDKILHVYCTQRVYDVPFILYKVLSHNVIFMHVLALKTVLTNTMSMKKIISV